MTLPLITVLLALLLAVLVATVVRVIEGDGSLDVLGHARRRPAGSLPRSHRDPFEPRSWGPAL